jgi:hypothetical protein
MDSIRNAVVDVHLKLGDIIPAKSALLQNYPNPFNPETWIPYEIGDACDVSINIFDVQGKLVRSLHHGYKEIGQYFTKDKAAYWDGRNTFGEKVASGVYFYQMQTGDLASTRKMVVVE